MKILQFAELFFPSYGGYATRIYNIFLHNSNIHYLYIPYPKNSPNLNFKENFGNIRVRRCGLWINRIGKKNEKFDVILNHQFLINLNARKLLRFVKEKDFNIIHGHAPLVYATAAMKYAKKFHLPLVYETHLFGTDEPIIKNRWYIPKIIYYLIKRPLKLKEKKICKYANRIIVQTNAIKKRIVKLYQLNPTKVIVIPMAVDTDKFDPFKLKFEGQKLRQEMNWDNKIIFLYNGFLEEVNGIEFFFNTIIKLNDSEKKKIKIIVFGQGPLIGYIKDLSSKYKELIEFHDLVDYNQMPLYYSASDVVVNPRLNIFLGKDNVPTKMLEGMAMEKIVLGSDINAITEIVTNRNNGIIFKSGNQEDLLDKLNYIINNIETMDDIRKQARECIIEKYTWDRMRKKLNILYNEIS